MARAGWRSRIFIKAAGWGQNVRFAQTRAIVEEGRFAIDSYLLYFGEESERGTRLVRVPVQDGEYTWHG